MNSKGRHTLPDRVKPYVMAYRGNQVLCPENTIAAFQKALVEGADILETDLQVASDNVFMCIHDSTVDRTTNGQGEIAEMPLAELKTLSASCGHFSRVKWFALWILRQPHGSGITVCWVVPRF